MRKLFLSLLFISAGILSSSAQVTVFSVTAFGALCNGVADDSVPINAAIAAAIAAGGGEVQFPTGTCRGNLVITKGKGLKLRGAARLATTIKAIGSAPALKANGLWYSVIEDLTFATSSGLSNQGVVEIDGNYDGTNTQGVQANSFRDLLIAGRGLDDGQRSTYTFTMCRQGGSSCQGSENKFDNVHLSGSSFANYFQNGYNALNNLFIGGNDQDYLKHGMYFLAGSFHIYGRGFQSANGFAQIDNDGYDINANSGGTGDQIGVYGCRSESLRFYRGGHSQPATIRNFTHRPAVGIQWQPNTSYPLGTLIYKMSNNANSTFYHQFRVTAAGTSGATQPVWANSGTVTDGTATWTEYVPVLIDLPQGDVDFKSVAGYGRINARGVDFLGGVEVSANYTVSPGIGYVLVNPTTAPITISLYGAIPAGPSNAGQQLIIQRANTSIYPVMITGIAGPGPITQTLAGGTLASATIVYGGGGNVAQGARLVSITNN